jgi:hypothetical protein
VTEPKTNQNKITTIMKIDIIDGLTPEQQQTVQAFALAVKQGHKGSIEYLKDGIAAWKATDTDYIIHIRTPYRIKPQPAYRPWTPEEALGQKVRRKGSHEPLILITRVTSGGAASVHGMLMSVEEVLKDYETLDGQPCGVLTAAPEAPAADDDGWIRYGARVGMPTHLKADTMVRVRIRSGCDLGSRRAWDWNWLENGAETIIAYKVC